jgi:hypothetical protein
MSKYIDEMEEYLGLLQAKRAMIQHQVTEADEQLGMVREALDSDGIAEVSLIDNESSSTSSPPRSSDYMCLRAWDQIESPMLKHRPHTTPSMNSMKPLKPAVQA